MPRASHINAIARQWELLKQLPARAPGMTADQLTQRLGAAGFVVAKRTVERDLAELSRIFALISNDKSKPYGWHWAQGRGADLPGLTLADALSLRLVEDLLRPLLPAAVLAALEPRLRQAHDKLTALGAQNASARWAGKVRYSAPALPLIPPQIAEGVLETVQQALLDDRQLDVDYQRPDETTSHKWRLHPLGLAQRGPITYLAATAFDYSDVRLYAVHRIRTALETSEAARPPAGFDFGRYVEDGALQFSQGKTIRLKARVSDSLAGFLREAPLAKDQNLSGKEGSLTVDATVMDSWQLRWWILSQGNDIRITAPASLRRRIEADLRAALAGYVERRR